MGSEEQPPSVGFAANLVPLPPWLAQRKGPGWHRGQEEAEEEHTRLRLTLWHHKLCSCLHPLFSIIYFEHLDQQFVRGEKKKKKK